MTQQRVATLLPSATEIVCALGGRDLLVGRSHECDHPDGLSPLPVLTRPRTALEGISGEIDRAVRDLVSNALSVYEVDVDTLAAARPDVIVTQDLCEVCAVNLDDVRKALIEVGLERCEILSLRPTRLAHVWDDVRRVGRALGLDGEHTAQRLEQRCLAIGDRSEGASRPTVLTIEWLDPVMIGGTWMPDLVEVAGGHTLVATAGTNAPTLSAAELDRLAPDVVLVKPCGYPVEATLRERELLEDVLCDHWPAVRSGRVFIADGNAFFNRSGPRLVESLEILAACLHPSRFADEARAHEASFVSLSDA